MNEKEYNRCKSVISTCPLFSGMPEEELHRMLGDETCSIIAAEKGSLIASGALYIVLKGTLVIEKQASDGRYVTMGTVYPPAAVGAASVFLKGESISLMKAQSECILLKLEEPLLHRALLQGGVFAVNLTEFLAQRIRFLNQKIASLAGYSASSRLLMYLENNNRDGEAIIPMTLTDFAEYLGVGRASLYRTLDQLQSEGRIRRSGRKITLLNPV